MAPRSCKRKLLVAIYKHRVRHRVPNLGGDQSVVELLEGPLVPVGAEVRDLVEGHLTHQLWQRVDKEEVLGDGHVVPEVEDGVGQAVGKVDNLAGTLHELQGFAAVNLRGVGLLYVANEVLLLLLLLLRLLPFLFCYCCCFTAAPAPAIVV